MDSKSNNIPSSFLVGASFDDHPQAEGSEDHRHVKAQGEGSSYSRCVILEYFKESFILKFFIQVSGIATANR
ncbi:hypothetical protein Q3G72_012064 [Acer saccharum]|nr:hypothetical protein Q3G72_012064 [Acer saccharum]